MEMPSPTSAHDPLKLLAGTWTGEEKMHPSPWDEKGGMAAATIDNRLALGGMVLVQDYVQKRGDKTSFEGHAVFVWDAPQESFVCYWFDSMGMRPNEYTGRFEGKILTMTSKGPQSRITFDLSHRYEFKMEVTTNGQTWNTLMEGSYRRTHAQA